MSGGPVLFRGAIHGFPGRDLGLLIEGDVVTWLGEGRPPRRPAEEIVAGPGEIIAPGVIDLHVNGFARHNVAVGYHEIQASSQATPTTGLSPPPPTPNTSPAEDRRSLIQLMTCAGCFLQGA